MVRAERGLRRQVHGHVSLFVLVDHRLASVPAHQFVVHKMIVAEESRADRAVGNDAGERLQHVVGRRGERDRLDQHQSVVDRFRREKLGQHTEQDIILTGDIDRVARRIGLVPVGAERLLPAGDHLHPMPDLSLRRPGNVLLQQRALLLGELLHRLRRDRVRLQGLVHERDIVLKDGAVDRLPVITHRRRIEAIERGLHSAAVGGERATPSQVVRAAQIGNEDFRQRHRAVSDRLQQLIDERNRRRVDRRHAGAIKDKTSAGAGKQPEDDRVLGQDVLFENLPGVAVELEHGGVELQDVLGADLGRARLLHADDRL